ncbi:MAG: glycosyltransferase family 4 protein [Planctomycetota bacterium]
MVHRVNEAPPTPSASNPPRPLRVALCQPALPKYRVPVFATLADRPGIDLTVWYGEEPTLANVEPVGFHGEQRSVRPIVGPLRWNNAAWEACGGAFDVAVLSWNANDPTLYPAIRKARRNGVGTVLWGHGYSKREKGWRKRVRDRIGRSADAVVLYDRATAARLVAEGFDAGRVFVAANTLDAAPMEAALANVTDGGAGLRTKLGLSAAPVLLFVSRVSPKSRLDLLLTALADIPDARLLVVGGGELEPLQALADELGVAERVTWVGPVYDESALAPYFAVADLFVYPAAIGLSLIHAMIYGLPVVTAASRERQNPEINALIEGQTGMTYEDGNAADLAGKINQLLTDDDLRHRMSRAAHARVRSEFSLAGMVDGLEAAIRKAAARVSG